MPLRAFLAAVLAPACGGLTWLGIVGFRLRSVDETLWIARDDAVITLSHARNAAEFGSIGVSPGDRVEGFSSPLHFAVAYLIELVADPGYRTLSIVILLLMSALTGAFVAGSVQALAHSAGVASPRQQIASVLLTAAAAVTVAGSWTSVGWIGSGMENPVVICAGMAVLFAATGRLSHQASQRLLIASLVFFMISRVELAAFSMPLVLAAAWMNSTRATGGKQVRSFVQTTGATLLLVAFVHLSRRWYFGDWLPNTAVVQGRATGFTQLLVIALIASILLVALAVAFVKAHPTIAKRRGMAADLRIIGALMLVGLVLMGVSGRTGSSLNDLVSMRALPPLLLLIGAMLLIQRAVTTSPWIPNHVFAALASVPLAQFVAMGPARLDNYRVAVIAIPFLAVWAVALSIHVVTLLHSAEATPSWLGRLRPKVLAGSIAAAMIVAVAFIAAGDGTRRLNWEIGSAPILIDVVHDVRDQQFAGGLALTANPDLGKVSYDKSAVITDLALLGDPLLTKIADVRPDLVTTFMHFVARPDVLEAHGVWACRYSAWLASPQFAESYTFSDERWDDGRTETDDCGFGGQWVIWIRSDADAEYELTRNILAADDPIPVVQAALDQCRVVAGEDVFSCQGLRRSLQRASASLRQAGTYNDAVDLLRGSPSAAFDLPMLRRGRGWAAEASEGFITLMNG